MRDPDNGGIPPVNEIMSNDKPCTMFLFFSEPIQNLKKVMIKNHSAYDTTVYSTDRKICRVNMDLSGINEACTVPIQALDLA